MSLRPLEKRFSNTAYNQYNHYYWNAFRESKSVFNCQWVNIDCCAHTRQEVFVKMCLAHGGRSWSEDLNEIIDLVNFWGKKIVYLLKIGGFRNGTQQDLNKMVDMVKFWGAKRSSRCRKWGAKPRRIPTDSQRGSAPPPPPPPPGFSVPTIMALPSELC